LIGQIGQIHIDDMKLIQFALLLSHIGRILATTDSGEVSWFPANGSFKSFHPKAPPFAATKDEELDKLYGVMKDAFTKIIPDSTITDFKANVVLMGLEKDQFGKVMELFKTEEEKGYLTYPKNLGLMTGAVKWEPRANAAGAAGAGVPEGEIEKVPAANPHLNALSKAATTASPHPRLDQLTRVSRERSVTVAEGEAPGEVKEPAKGDAQEAERTTEEEPPAAAPAPAPEEAPPAAAPAPAPKEAPPAAAKEVANAGPAQPGSPSDREQGAAAPLSPSAPPSDREQEAAAPLPPSGEERRKADDYAKELAASGKEGRGEGS